MEKESLLTWLYSLENMGIKLGLENMNLLLNRLGNPERDFQSIHVAGTNGKGSTSAFIESILIAEGYRTGLYSSPHFVDIEERIRIDGKQVTEKEFMEAATTVRSAANELFSKEKREITFFEIITAIAFLLFSLKGVDYAVVEVGLGGRLDATNVIKPAVSVITHVALEHTQYLGNTLEAIAAEKGGIIKDGVPVITAETAPGPLGVILGIAKDRHSEVVRAQDVAEVVPVVNRIGELVVDVRGNADYGRLRSGLWGSFQTGNIGLALAASERLQREGVFLSESSITSGIANVKWKGRLQLARAGKEFIFDSAHNPDAVSALSDSLRDAGDVNLLCVVGILSDKKIEDMMPVMRNFCKHMICVSPRTARARRAEDVGAGAARAGISATVAGDTRLGMEKALSDSSGGRVLVTGSMRTVGEAMEWWREKFGESLWK